MRLDVCLLDRNRLTSLNDSRPKKKKFKSKLYLNTPGTEGGPGSRDRTLAVKVENPPENQLVFVKQ